MPQKPNNPVTIDDFATTKTVEVELTPGRIALVEASFELISLDDFELFLADPTGPVEGETPDDERKRLSANKRELVSKFLSIVRSWNVYEADGTTIVPLTAERLNTVPSPGLMRIIAKVFQDLNPTTEEASVLPPSS